jgi:hypothetical protein
MNITGIEEVYAMALHNSQLFVTRNQKKFTDQIEVFDASTLQLLRCITIPGTDGDLCGLAVDPIVNSLYVSDKPQALSVNNAHNILVGDSGSKIVEYTPSGIVVREIAAGGNIWHAMELTNDTLIASRNNGPNDVCILSKSGQVIYSYGSAKRGSGYGYVNATRSLVVDKQGYVLVADMHNNRILAFDQTLSAARNLSLPVSLTWPRALWLDESRDRLYVGEGSGENRILVFDNFASISDVFSTDAN